MLVGRAAELRDLVLALDEVKKGRGRLLFLVGEAGIGKSYAAEAMAREAEGRGVRVRWGRCVEAGGAPAYWPWIEILRACLEEPEAAEVLGELGAQAGDLLQLVPELTVAATAPPLP